MTHLLILLACLFMLLATAPSAALGESPQHSALWGEAGEAWSPESRLPDFSQAGFERGEMPLPDLGDAPTHNVRDFGARGDGEHDDTAAFHAAIAEAGAGVIEIPPGRYVITDFLDIERSNLVLRGAGEDETTLYFPKTLTDIEPNWGATTTGQRTSNYSWAGGFIRIRGADNGEQLGAVSERAPRGATSLVLDSPPTDLQAGDEVRLAMVDDDEQTLAQYLYAGDAGPIDNLPGLVRPSQTFRVVSVEGSEVHLDRPLRFDVRPEWQPTLHVFAPTVTHSGVEHLTLEFPAGDYQGHFTELGHNGIAIGNVAHCWVRHVRFRNAESGPFVHGRFCTLTHLTWESDRAPDDRNHRGHHGITLSGEDNLLTDFAMKTRYIHDITVTRGSIGNVIARGRGVDLNLDHHRYGPYENLFTELDAGEGSRFWASGGGAALGKHAAARNTYWNIRAANPIPAPPEAFAPPQINVVGITTNAPANTTPDAHWFEPIAPEALQPQNLYEAQRTRRLEAASAPASE